MSQTKAQGSLCPSAWPGKAWNADEPEQALRLVGGLGPRQARVPDQGTFGCATGLPRPDGSCSGRPKSQSHLQPNQGPAQFLQQKGTL